jgi:GTP-binding protein LepA
MEIRNFVIIAHIDHGKSTLADRFLEITGTIPARQMKPQYLDRLELERERGITIKMAPVRMSYILNSKSYVLNLIDTPGHSDFTYEVSRALLAVEGAILLVDVSKGIQAQTLSNFRLAKQAGLKIIGAVNKIDLYPLRAEKTKINLAKLIGVQPEEIYAVSAKTGEGVKELLEGVIKQVPSPKNLASEENGSQALIFDSLYNDHKGVLAFSRIFSGEFLNGQNAVLLSSKRKFKIKEVGCFTPDFKAVGKLSEGEIGYLATGLKEPNLIKIGDTIGLKEAEPLIGFKEPQPVIFVSFYPTEKTTFEDLENGFKRLKLNDAALSFEKDSNEILGKGLKVGFLGELHFEITSERLEKESNLEFLTTFPSVIYRVIDKSGSHFIKHPQNFTGDYFKIFQPMIKLEILTPTDYLNQILALAKIFHLNILEIKNFSEENLLLVGRMPLAELIKDFSDQLKSVSAGYASFSYDFDGEETVDIGKLEILVANEPLPALTRLVLKGEVEREGRILVERLKDLLPRQQFSQALQAKAEGRIIARETIPAISKELGNFGKNGGDRTRKMKLWKKQKRGKEKLKSLAKVKISAEIFRELLKK